MRDADFYEGTSVLETYAEVADADRYQALPDSWSVAVADVRGSTEAVRRGEYKAVNVVGVSVLSAVRNAVEPRRIPFVFGGDGATLCVPEEDVGTTREALLATRTMARERFGLELAVGLVPVSALREAGHQVLVARHRLSATAEQAVFRGKGLDVAEGWVKKGEHALNGSGDEAADFSGLECRWREVESARGETIALLVSATSRDLAERSELYAEVIDLIESAYGADARPVRAEALRLARSPKALGAERNVRTFGQGTIARTRYLAYQLYGQVAAAWLFSQRREIGGVPWHRYKSDAAANTDYRKFDGTVRQVLSGTAEQRSHLREGLEKLREAGRCVYGVHVSKARSDDLSHRRPRGRAHSLRRRSRRRLRPRRRRDEGAAQRARRSLTVIPWESAAARSLRAPDARRPRR